MNIHVISLFPEMFSAVTEHGVVARSIHQGVIDIAVHNPRDFADDKHSTVDDRPYGGGPGMVMMPDLLAKVLSEVLKLSSGPHKVVYMSPQGDLFNHDLALKVARQSASGTEYNDSLNSLVLIAGRYEGVDERFIQRYVDEEWSAGDYVLSGGELPAMIVIDAITRLLPHSLGNAESAQQDSFVNGLLDCPHFTRPESFDGEQVPTVLLSGDHKRIADWRLKQALGRTWLRRPDLLSKKQLSAEEVELLTEFKREYQQDD